MMIRRPPRSGLSLLEVLLSLVIFLFALIGLGQLMNLCTEQAAQIQHLNRAGQLLQSKMNEVIAGVVPLSGQGDSEFDEDPDWVWSLECQGDNTPNLWTVTVTVSHKAKDGTKADSWSLTQKVLDPQARGNFDPPATSTTGGM
jgi:Tfp pilus assembly protein PilV